MWNSFVTVLNIFCVVVVCSNVGAILLFTNMNEPQFAEITVKNEPYQEPLLTDFPPESLPKCAEKSTAVHQESSRHRVWRCLKRLALVEFFLAFLILSFGSTCLAYSFDKLKNYNHFCYDASGIWSGLICVVCGSVGFTALYRSSRSKRRCLYVTYLIFLILSSVGCGIVMVMSSIWFGISISVYISKTSNFYLLLIISFNFILVLISLLHCEFVDCSHSLK